MSRALRALDVLAVVALGVAIASSVARPLFYWDSWAYHLPFSALLWDIGGARQNFVLSDEMAVRYAGFPLAAEALQGLFWKWSGTINATTLINSGALAAFAIVAARALRGSVPVLAFGALAAPLIALHATSSYIDLFVGVCIASQALAAVKIEALLRHKESLDRMNIAAVSTDEYPMLARWCVVYIAAAALAGNSKVMAVAMSGAIGAFLAGYLVLARRRLARRGLALAAVAIVLGGTFAAGTALRNAERFGNPVYPVAATIAGFQLNGPEPEYASNPRYTTALGPLARPVNWLLSVTEIDWTIRGISPKFTLDSATGESPGELPARTGGYWAPLVVASVAFAAVLALRLRRRDAARFAEQRFLIALFAFVSVVTAFMPQSHELRYSLHWPLLLMLLVSVLAARAGPRASAALALAYLGAFVVSQHMLGYNLRVGSPVTQADTVSGMTRSAVLADVRSRRAVCLGPDYQPGQFAYAAVFHGGDYVVEQGWTRCVRYPAFANSNPPPP